MNVCALLSLSVLSAKAQTTYMEMEQLTVNDQVTTVITASEPIRFVDISTDKVVGDQPINNTIRLAILARRKEIAIMRLVGASNGFIRGPFLMEGALHAIIGSLLAVGCLELLRTLALPKLQSALMFLNFDLSLNTFLFIYAVLVGAGLLIGLLGSAFAMRRYLKV